MFASPSVVHRPAHLHLVIAASLAGTLAAFEAASGRVHWALALGKPLFSSPVACETLERVLLGCVNARVYCARLADGALLWTLPTDGPVYSANVLELCDEDEEEEEDEEQVDDHNRFASAPASAPRSRLRLAVGAIGSHDAHLYLFDLRDGRLLARHALDSPLYAVPSLSL